MKIGIGECTDDNFCKWREVIVPSLKKGADDVARTLAAFGEPGESLTGMLDRLSVKKANTPKIVCLCGSTRFMDAFHAANERLTLEGKIVLSVGCNTKGEGAFEISEEQKAALDELHLRKIDLAHTVLFLNVIGYIGHSTRRELAYALYKGKNIQFLEPEIGEKFLTDNRHEIGILVAQFVKEDCGISRFFEPTPDGVLAVAVTNMYDKLTAERDEVAAELREYKRAAPHAAKLIAEHHETATELKLLKVSLSDAVTAVQQERDKQVAQLRCELKAARDEVDALKKDHS